MQDNTAYNTENNEDKIILEETSPLNKRVVLRKRCYDYHTDLDNKGEKDIETRDALIENEILQNTIKNPRFIYRNEKDADNRHRYIQTFADSDISDHLIACVVYVDHDRSPFEIASWGARRRLTSECFDGGIIYDENQND